MSHSLRSRVVAYDNIAVGAAVSDEEHFQVGDDPPAQTYAQGENVLVGEALSEENMTPGVDFPDELLTP